LRIGEHGKCSVATVSHYNHFLPLEAQSVEVVLVSPRNPLNIGAAARAMANFGFARLAVVAPFEAHWREARSAVGAPDLLRNAKESPTVAEAVAGCTLVIGTGTLVYRKPEQRVVKLPKLSPLVQEELARGGRIALVFGPEKHGLTREDLSWCQLLVEIPTDPRQPSMNLGQAVAVCLYELSSRAFQADAGAEAHINLAAPSARLKSCPVTEHSGISVGESAAGESAVGESADGESVDGVSADGESADGESADQLPAAAASGSLDLLAGVIEETMTAAGYSPRSMQAANRHDLRLLLRRLAPSGRDTRRILGLFRRILFRLRRGPD
jgi:tRNA/rRNA methyltransferase